MRVFIDGSAGTTGLALEGRLENMAGIELVKPAASLRKDVKTRRQYLNEADVAFLCLPDDAAREAAAMVENPDTVVIDASTAHRTAPGWAYGFPELSAGHLRQVQTARRIAVPGCHASGFIALVYVAKQAGFVYPDDVLFCYSLTGYSGGGKNMIAAYEDENSRPSAAKLYAMGLSHKHLPEMQHVCGLTRAPVFVPVVVNARQGMITSVPLSAPARAVWEFFREYYKETETIRVMPFMETDYIPLEDMADPGGLSADPEGMEIYICGHEGQTVLSARFDNLGKGSSGAAVQCMKVRTGYETN